MSQPFSVSTKKPSKNIARNREKAEPAMQHVPPKRQLTFNRLYGAESQKTDLIKGFCVLE
jgi:hypothetical protein